MFDEPIIVYEENGTPHKACSKCLDDFFRCQEEKKYEAEQALKIDNTN